MTVPFGTRHPTDPWRLAEDDALALRPGPLQRPDEGQFLTDQVAVVIHLCELIDRPEVRRAVLADPYLDHQGLDILLTRLQSPGKLTILTSLARSSRRRRSRLRRSLTRLLRRRSANSEFQDEIELARAARSAPASLRILNIVDRGGGGGNQFHARLLLLEGDAGQAEVWSSSESLSPDIARADPAIMTPLAPGTAAKAAEYIRELEAGSWPRRRLEVHPIVMGPSEVSRRLSFSIPQLALLAGGLDVVRRQTSRVITSAAPILARSARLLPLIASIRWRYGYPSDHYNIGPDAVPGIEQALERWLDQHEQSVTWGFEPLTEGWPIGHCFQTVWHLFTHPDSWVDAARGPEGPFYSLLLWRLAPDLLTALIARRRASSLLPIMFDLAYHAPADAADPLLRSGSGTLEALGIAVLRRALPTLADVLREVQTRTQSVLVSGTLLPAFAFLAADAGRR
jgi:hypothetical protein